MKTIAIFVVLLPLLVTRSIGATPVALQEFSRTMSGAKNFSLHFAYIVQNGGSIEAQDGGTIAVSNAKYRLNTDKTLVVFDGKARYTYIKDAQEIVIETPNPLRDGIFADPSAIFSINYSDFNIKEQPSDSGNANFDLTPKQDGLPYEKITLALDNAAHFPRKIVYYGADGRTTALVVSEFKVNTKPLASDFVFDAKNYPQAEVVDMR